MTALAGTPGQSRCQYFWCIIHPCLLSFPVLLQSTVWCQIPPQPWKQVNKGQQPDQACGATGRWQVPQYAHNGSVVLTNNPPSAVRDGEGSFYHHCFCLSPTIIHPWCHVRHQELQPQRKRGQMETSSLALVMALEKEPCQPMWSGPAQPVSSWRDLTGPQELPST